MHAYYGECFYVGTITPGFAVFSGLTINHALFTCLGESLLTHVAIAKVHSVLNSIIQDCCRMQVHSVINGRGKTKLILHVQLDPVCLVQFHQRCNHSRYKGSGKTRKLGLQAVEGSAARVYTYREAHAGRRPGFGTEMTITLESTTKPRAGPRKLVSRARLVLMAVESGLVIWPDQFSEWRMRRKVTVRKSIIHVPLNNGHQLRSF